MTDRVMMTNLWAHALQRFPRTATRTTTTTTMGDGAVDQGDGAREASTRQLARTRDGRGETDGARLV
jgi:hypothetical protein